MKQHFLWVMWVAMSIAVIAGIAITKSAWCLWAFLIPFLVSEDAVNK